MNPAPSSSPRTAIFFFQFRERLDRFAGGADQQHQIVFEYGEGAGARRHLGVGAQHRQSGPPAIELGQRLGIIRIGHGLETQPRSTVLEGGGELAGKPRLRATCIADGEGQRFGMLQPGARAPNCYDGKNQGQRGKQQHLSTIAPGGARTRGRLVRLRRGDVSAHGLYPGPGRGRHHDCEVAPKRDRKCLKKNNNFLSVE